VTADRVELRVRVAPVPEEPRERREPGLLPRRFFLPHVHADDSERLVRATVVEPLDGVPSSILVVPAPGDEPEDLAPIPSAPGVLVTPAVVSADQLGRRLARVCGSRGVPLAAFDLAWTMGRLAAHARTARGGGVSIALAGCGWYHDQIGKWDDAYTKARLRVDGRFCRWLPPRKVRKGERSRGGPIVQLDVLGEALGCDVSSTATLAASLGVPWPAGPASVQQLVEEGLALARCYLTLVADLDEVAPGLAPWEVWSAGSIVTTRLLRAGVRPAALSMANVPPRAVGAAAAAFHGGEATATLVGMLA
jgi:hypothetical protein